MVIYVSTYKLIEQPSSVGLLLCTSVVISLYLSHVVGDSFNFVVRWILFLECFWHWRGVLSANEQSFDRGEYIGSKFTIT